MVVIGVDPGTAISGYAVIESQAGNKKLREYGTIQTSPDISMAERLVKVNLGLNEIISRYHPQVMAIEQIFFHKNNKTVITVAQSRGVLIMTAAAAGLDVAEYTPLQVKQAVVGYGGADKKQVQFMVQRILGLREIPKPDDAADAIAIALCHLHSYRINSFAEEKK